MHAAVVTTFDAPPHYTEFPDPVANGKNELVAEVLAAALHPRVRSQANGSHYAPARRSFPSRQGSTR